MTHDPFRHHPELRGQITPHGESFFRDMDLAEIDRQVIAAGQPPDWRTPCEIRERNRKAWLDGHLDEDLWLFGYGSLMWDPSVRFSEVRRAHSPVHARSFCLWDDGGRGSIDHPGLMLALDDGGGCSGLAFRIPAEGLDHETFVLFRREMIFDAYQPAWVRLETAQGEIDAVTFVANHGHDLIRPGIPLEEQARMISRAEGMLERNFAYLDNTLRHLALLKVDDPYIRALHAAASAMTSTARCFQRETPPSGERRNTFRTFDRFMRARCGQRSRDRHGRSRVRRTLSDCPPGHQDPSSERHEYERKRPCRLHRVQ